MLSLNVRWVSDENDDCSGDFPCQANEDQDNPSHLRMSQHVLRAWTPLIRGVRQGFAHPQRRGLTPAAPNIFPAPCKLTVWPGW